ncbi:hypothetical protein Pcinc_008477 [Petrolisthes cinctipes]|uniref:C2H2-type domain-containing protein n=1 Tax=Petrolisthes cinctipes TaxID=88211 RepID=A0AAE1GD39_PETCI|nr:hypothetical protein Pcinc_008477 [Petrolisthes cinctipes]
MLEEDDRCQKGSGVKQGEPAAPITSEETASHQEEEQERKDHNQKEEQEEDITEQENKECEGSSAAEEKGIEEGKVEIEKEEVDDEQEKKEGEGEVEGEKEEKCELDYLREGEQKEEEKKGEVVEEKESKCELDERKGEHREEEECKEEVKESLSGEDDKKEREIEIAEEKKGELEGEIREEIVDEEQNLTEREGSLTERHIDEEPIDVDALVGTGEEDAVVEVYTEQEHKEEVSEGIPKETLEASCTQKIFDSSAQREAETEELEQDGGLAEQEVEEEGSPIDNQGQEGDRGVGVVHWETDHQYSKPLERVEEISNPNEEGTDPTDTDEHMEIEKNTGEINVDSFSPSSKEDHSMEVNVSTIQSGENIDTHKPDISSSPSSENVLLEEELAVSPSQSSENINTEKLYASSSSNIENVMTEKVDTTVMEQESDMVVDEQQETNATAEEEAEVKEDIDKDAIVPDNSSATMAPCEVHTSVSGESKEETNESAFRDDNPTAMEVEESEDNAVDIEEEDTGRAPEVGVSNDNTTPNEAEAEPGFGQGTEEETVDSDARSDFLVIDSDAAREEEAIIEQKEGTPDNQIQAREHEASLDTIADQEVTEPLESDKSTEEVHELGETEEVHELGETEEVHELGETEDMVARTEEGEESEVNPSGPTEEELEDFNEEDGNYTSATLPQCRLKRNYCCIHCGINTQNPREYLYHLRDDHGEKMKVFECPRCIYASKNHQKLIRHARMVHKLKIKRLEASTSPYKGSSPILSASPVKPIKTIVMPSKNTRSSPGKSPRRTESPPDTWEDMDEEDDQMEQDEYSVKGDDKKLLFCEHCEYSCRSRKLLNKHETSYHLKRRFFRCLKCNYVTHLKGRYTKHMKYHQLPILKCSYCDFRTPYRWNLDRHLKNHTEDNGEYKCHLCNFTAQIKQSLTVHISNHHLTAEQIREKEMRRTIGISDPADCTSDDQELEMLRLERDEHPDALLLPGFSAPGSPSTPEASHGQHNGNSSFRVSNIDVGGQDDSQMNAEDNENEDGEPRRKKPKIKITLTKMKAPKTKDTFFQELNERHNFEEDFIHPDDVVHRHGNVYIKTFKCRFCSFKAAFKNEVSRHEKKIHCIPLPKPEGTGVAGKAKKSFKSRSSRHTSNTDDVISQILQYPQTESTSLQTEPKSRDDEYYSSRITDGGVEAKDENSEDKYSIQGEDSINPSRETSPEPPESQSHVSKESSPSKDCSKKKNPSFFDKLQEKMPTSNVQNLVCQFCGHESKCLSESVRHQKLHLSAKNIYASASLSTRCQFCRHRCKTTDDLVHHLKLCPEARKNQITDSGRRLSDNRFDDNEDSLSSGRGENMDEDDNEDSEKKEDGFKDEEGDDASSLAALDESHPMENRVFVWNKFDKAQEEDQEKEKTDQDEIETVGKWNRRDSTESVKKLRRSESPVSFDMGALDYIESPTPQGSHYYSKRVYRCPQCSFWATTASRFHVHIVGHFNRKPYNCSECSYKSNWRWDITKHIKLKASRDTSHNNAEVIITDETGEKNYEKYDCYLSIIQLDETNAHRTEGGIPNRKGRPKRTPEKEEIMTEMTRPATPTTPATTIRKPPMVAIPMMPRLQNLPRLTRAPGRIHVSRPGPNPFGPILPGAQMMVQLAGSGASTAPVSQLPQTTPTTSTANSAAVNAAKAAVAAAAAAAAASAAQGASSVRPPPPLTLRGTPKPPYATTSIANKASTGRDSPATTPGQYEIITSQRPSENLLVLKSLVIQRCSDRMVLQGSVNTSLETLQLLASGSTNLSKLKKQPKGSLVDSEEKDSQSALSHQVSVSSTGDDGKEVARMVLDHEGNPEWKCYSCDFRDSERETVIQHVRLAHTRNGPVSLLHAVHRCDVCGYAAGTKRAVQLHIDSSHAGQGGITSRCEGQNPESKDAGGTRKGTEGEGGEHGEGGRSFQCRLCPFTCTKRSQMRPHLLYHVARPDCIFKCMFCPYYVPTKGELFEHLSLHDDCPWAVLDQVNLNRSNSNSPGPSGQDENGPRQFVCGSCPYESRSRSKLMHHRQFHKPKGLPFRCPHCTYNVTRRHLLSQHIRVHGVEDNFEGMGNVVHVDERSNSPSPSLTITPVTNAATSGTSGDDQALPDSSQLPKLTDEATMNMEDIPLAWVSRDRRFFKMFKCRHCPHVNLRKTNIQEHEKMHKANLSKEAGGLHCPYCSYGSVNAGVMSAHLKVHGGSMGQCHAVVDPSLSDEEQLKQLTSRALAPSPGVPQIVAVVDDTSSLKADEKVLYYCQHCPARFFLEKEVQIHSRFHKVDLPLTCDHCNYGARQSAHLLTHLKVHTPEYQQRTRTMMGQHRAMSSYPPVQGLSIPDDFAIGTSQDNSSLKSDGGQSQGSISGSTPPVTSALPQPAPTSKYMCDECPALFSKQVTLQYHQSLHGSKNSHSCSRCSYSGKTSESLQQHVQLHIQHDQSCQAEKTAKEASKKTEVQKTLEASIKTKIFSKHSEKDPNSYHPPIKLKLIGLRPGSSDKLEFGSRPQFKYYVEEQVPLSGVDLLRRKNQMEKEENDRPSSDAGSSNRTNGSNNKNKSTREYKDKEDTEDDPKRIGNPKLNYPLHIDKVTGRSREKRYKCQKCPSAFEKVEQYNVHSNLHGSSHKYKCRICDYSVKFYANFMMHINRHKYHERIISQTEGSAPPVDTDPKYEPIISVFMDSSSSEKVRSHIEDSGNKENLEEADLTTTERQHLLLQNKKGVTDSAKRDEEKERKVYYCQYCPYANVRRDAVDSHSLRHHANGGYGSYRCTFCDYTASQPNFIREHTKVHFRPFKYVTPEGFMRHDREELISTRTIIGGNAGGGPKADGKSQPTQAQEKYFVFANEMGDSKPTLPSDGEDENNTDVNPMKQQIQVNFRSGDVVDAPNDFVISLRPAKSKGSHSHLETAENVACESSEAVEKSGNTSSLGLAAQSCIDQVPDQMEHQPAQEGVQVIGISEKKMDFRRDENKTSQAYSDCCQNDNNQMEVDHPNTDRPGEEDVCIAIGYDGDEPRGTAVSVEAMETDNKGKGVTEDDKSNVHNLLQPNSAVCENDHSKEAVSSH